VCVKGEDSGVRRTLSARDAADAVDVQLEVSRSGLLHVAQVMLVVVNCRGDREGATLIGHGRSDDSSRRSWSTGVLQLQLLQLNESKLRGRSKRATRLQRAKDKLSTISAKERLRVGKGEGRAMSYQHTLGASAGRSV
jgi:hypothetical protein